MDSMRKQAERFGAEFVADNATLLDLTGDVKTVAVGATAYRARAVILAMGSSYRSSARRRRPRYCVSALSQSCLVRRGRRQVRCRLRSRRSTGQADQCPR
jgi:glycine/D-amino acid oxidase-like deaminating enzyme